MVMLIIVLLVLGVFVQQTDGKTNVKDRCNRQIQIYNSAITKLWEVVDKQDIVLYENRLSNTTIKRPSRNVTTRKDECPCLTTTILATITNIPQGSSVNCSGMVSPDDVLDNEVIKTCSECIYDITLPEGFHPRYHRHVICLDSKPYCIGGFGKCIASKVDVHVFKESPDNHPLFEDHGLVTFTKGCCCRYRKDFAFVGHGNFP